MIKHVIFDFDGTLVDSRYLIVDLFNQVAVKYGLRRINNKDYHTLLGLSMLERSKFLRVPLYLAPVIMFDLLQRYRRSITRVKLVDGMRPVIKSISKLGYKLSILSSNTKENIDVFLNTNGISEFSGVYSTNNSLQKEKPIHDFMLDYGLKAKEVIYVGDEVRDVVACQKNNVQIIAVTWGYDSKELLTKAGPDFVVDEPMAIVDVINER